MPLDEPKQVLAEDFENHAHVVTVRTSVCKMVEEGNDMALPWVRRRCSEELE